VNSCASLCRRHFIGWLEIWTANRWRMFRKKVSGHAAHARDFGNTTMTGWWFGSGMCDSAPLPWTTWMDRLEGIHHHIAGVAVRSRAVLERDNGRLSNGEQVNRLAALSLKRGKSVDFGGYWQRHSKDVHA